jgi:hypothetical protein
MKTELAYFERSYSLQLKALKSLFGQCTGFGLYSGNMIRTKGHYFKHELQVNTLSKNKPTNHKYIISVYSYMMFCAGCAAIASCRH